jgi:O-antigen ligase
MISFGRTYRKFLVAFAVTVFFTNISDFTVQYGLIPLVWIGIFTILAAPAILSGIARNTVPVRPIVWWCVFYVGLSIVSYYWSPQDEYAFQEAQTRIISVMFLILTMIAFSQPEEQRLAQKWIAGAVLLATALNIYELFNPLTFSNIPGRSSGLYSNVNQSGAALVLGLILSYQVIPDRLKLAYVTITALGVIPTFSRSAMIGWMVVVLYFFARAGIRVQIRRLVTLTVVCVGLTFSPLWSDIQQSLEQRGVITLNIAERIQFFTTGGRREDDSSNERKAVAERAWQLYGERPIIGWGTGASRRIEGFNVGTHNIYLAMLVDHGVLGFPVIPFLLLAALWGVNRRTIDYAAPWLLFMIMWGMFSHNVLEERYVLLAVALIARMIATNQVKRPTELEEPALDVLPARVGLAPVP